MERLGDILKKWTLKNTLGDTGSTGPGTSPEEEPTAPSCPLCRGTGWVRLEVPLGHPQFGKALPCRCQKQEDRAQRLARLQRYSNLGSLTRLTFETLNPRGRREDPEGLFQQAYEAALAFARNPEGWLVFTGPSGCGKTHLAAAIANRCLEEGYPAFFMVVPDLLDHLRSTYAPSSDTSYDELFEQVRNAPLLILDDLGAQSSTPWAQEKLYQIINHRFNARIPTVITTRLSLEQMDEYLKTRFSEPTLSRVFVLQRRQAPLFQKLGALEEELQRRMTFDNFDVRGNNADAQERASLEYALHMARSFARKPDGWLVFIGPNGCGKTHLAVAIANQCRKEGRAVFYVSVPELLDHLRRTYSPQSPIAYDELFEQVKTIPLLILEDLGAESSTPWAEEKLLQLFTYRYNARLPTVVTTTRLLEQLHPSLASRLKAPDLVTLIAIGAPDYRDQGKKRGRTWPPSPHRPSP